MNLWLWAEGERTRIFYCRQVALAAFFCMILAWPAIPFFFWFKVKSQVEGLLNTLDPRPQQQHPSYDTTHNCDIHQMVTTEMVGQLVKWSNGMEKGTCASDTCEQRGTPTLRQPSGALYRIPHAWS